LRCILTAFKHHAIKEIKKLISEKKMTEYEEILAAKDLGYISNEDFDYLINCY